MRKLVLSLALLAVALPAAADWVVGDARPDAPALAARGAYQVGVRTELLLHRGQVDILRATAANPAPRYDRALTVEVWYPAQLAPGEREAVLYTDVLGAGANNPARPNTPFTFAGRAARGAAALKGAFPLLIVSHGYPGSRLQMSYLTENLASKGYVVVAIDHLESTRADKAGFASTLLNRPLDDQFVLDAVAGWSQPGSGHFLAGAADAGNTALLGYSMGGYGALVAAGAAVDLAALKPLGVTDTTAFVARAPDPRIHAVVAFAPWGGARQLSSGASLAQVRVPLLFVAGEQDTIAGYEDGVLRLAREAVNAPRYLLAYQNARHNVSPNPPPAASYANREDFSAYAESAWDSARINNINQHVVTAFLEQTLRQRDMGRHLAPDSELSPARIGPGLTWRHWPAAAEKAD
ncbi:alpha/beta hydrolase family protein [Janthinobacterium psychrotolerans]|uniref:Putative dienelactone hydrolase n=1 Tax=Janthinobacterium psychrotolerans TaxID=1747903 RepID=A0A1A7BWF4_9BURK|nr:dienelactone hydrolase [Janthinobacterium psychrotolerans]OBV37079.1 putative dienelactone hydrolase [Janthinobacterium psychrotolerans]